MKSEARGLRGEEVGHHAQDEPRTEQPHRQIDEEDPAPPDTAGDGAPDQGPDGDRTSDHGAVDPEGGAPFLAREGLGD